MNLQRKIERKPSGKPPVFSKGGQDGCRTTNITGEVQFFQDEPYPSFIDFSFHYRNMVAYLGNLRLEQ
jgi:hypothetical protein